MNRQVCNRSQRWRTKEETIVENSTLDYGREGGVAVYWGMVGEGDRWQEAG